MDADEKAIRQRLKDDFPHYADRCLKIKTKSGGVVPLELNQAQLYIHERLEKQLAETGKIRALILKGRQQGASTYVEARFFWKVTHRKGVKAYILTHLDDATSNLFEMAKRYHDECPEMVKPSASASNAKEMVFKRLSSGYKVSTAGSKATGRSETLQYFHGSEVAYWPHAESHMAGVLQAIPSAPGTEVILESTSDGPDGLFYDLCMAAIAGLGDYMLVFVPWFWQDEYRKEADVSFTPTKEESEYAQEHGIDHEQLAWRRSKIVELRGEEKFRREYPATPEEAFTADVKGALWNRDTIDQNRVDVAPDLDRIIIAVDPAVTSQKDSDETGITVCGARGVGDNRHGYLLEDLSGTYTPEEWGLVVVRAYVRWKADSVIAEVNNGGDLVEQNLKTVPGGANIPYKAVHASRGKHTRAEPISSLDNQGRIHHVGFFPKLENQQCTWIPGRGKSPDRIDSRVWGFTELMLDSTEYKIW